MVRTPSIEELFKVHPQTEPEREVREWLKANRTNFTTMIRDEETGELRPKWSSGEVAHLAVSLGYDIVAVCAVMSHWNAATTGQRIENIMAQREYSWDVSLDEVQELRRKMAHVPELDLMPQWKAVNDYVLNGTEFTQ